MVATTSRWTATGIAAVGVTSIAAIYAGARGDRAHPPGQPPAAMAGPPRAAPASPSPAQPEGPPAIPTVTLPCVDDHTELRIGHDGAGRPVPVLCWGDHCIDDDRSPVPTPPAPATAASTPAAVVGLEQVCTGARCDPLGPRLRRVLAKADPGDHRSATRDHAAIAIQRDGAAEVWNRASDRRIDLGTSPIVDGDSEPDAMPESIDVLGDFLLVSWDCHEWCSSEAILLDARGRPSGDGLVEIRRASPRGASRIGTSIVAAGDDRFLVFGLFGEVSVIERGHVIARSLLVSPASGPIEFDARGLPDGDGNLDALWCHDATCQVTRISLWQEPAQGWRIDLGDRLVLPRCPGTGVRVGSSPPAPGKTQVSADR